MNQKQIPKKIGKDPIIEAIVELRFTSTIPIDAIFGLVYSKLQKIFPKYEALGILQLPEMVRNSDKNLEFAPHYKFTNEQFQVNLGPKVIAIINQKPYIGWGKYRKIIETILDELAELNFISTVNRIGIRYIDFFEEKNIFDYLEFNIENFPFKQTQSHYVTNFDYGKFKTTLQISNSKQIVMNGKHLSGSILDADTYTEEVISFNVAKLMHVIDETHVSEKELFYNLLKEEFINTLEPEYD